MTTTYSKYITLEELTCGNCGITFAVPQNWLAERRENGGGFTCPNGDARVFLKSELDKVREKLEAEQRRVILIRNERDAAERHASAMKGQVTRIKNRAKAGVCPCCNRSFVQLQRHMKSKHPDFEPSS
jgi:hypothetical protein